MSVAYALLEFHIVSGLPPTGLLAASLPNCGCGEPPNEAILEASFLAKFFVFPDPVPDMCFVLMGGGWVEEEGPSCGKISSPSGTVVGNIPDD